MSEYSDNDYIRKQAKFMLNNCNNKNAYNNAAWRLMSDTNETDDLSFNGYLTLKQLNRAKEIANEVLGISCNN